MVYHCRFCANLLEKTNPTPEQRGKYFATEKSYGYAQLYAHIEEAHGYRKDGVTGKLVKIKKGDGKGWRENPDTLTGKAPDHRDAALKAGAKKASNVPMRKQLDPQQIADERIKTAPNTDWHRKYRVKKSKEIEVDGHKGIVVLIEFTEPIPGERSPHEGNFVGASVIVVPDIHMNETNVIILYGYENWEMAEAKEFDRAIDHVKNHIKYRKCSKCGSYKPPRTTSRRAGRELTYVTSTCVDCGNKEVEPYD